MLGWFREGLQGTVSHLSSYFKSPTKGKRKRATEPGCSRDSPAKRPFALSTNDAEYNLTEEDQRRPSGNEAAASKLERRDVFSPGFRHIERRMQPVQQQQQQQQHRRWPQQYQQPSGPFTAPFDADAAMSTSHSHLPADLKQPQHVDWNGGPLQTPKISVAGVTRHNSIQRPLNAEFAQAVHVGAEDCAITTPTAPIPHLPQPSVASPQTGLRDGLSSRRGQHSAAGTAGLPASLRQRHATVTRQHGTVSRRVKVHFHFQVSVSLLPVSTPLLIFLLNILRDQSVNVQQGYPSIEDVISGEPDTGQHWAV